MNIWKFPSEFHLAVMITNGISPKVVIRCLCQYPKFSLLIVQTVVCDIYAIIGRPRFDCLRPRRVIALHQ